MSDDNNKKFTSLPPPVKLEPPEGNELPKRPRKRAMPEIKDMPIGMPGRTKRDTAPDDKGLGVFQAAQRDLKRRMPPPDGEPRKRPSIGETRRKPPLEGESRRRLPPPPPPPPQIKPGDIPRRRKKTPVVQEEKVQPKISPFQQVLGKIIYFRINPMFLSAVGWIVLAIAVVGVIYWFTTNLLVDNAFAVYLDGEHIGYIRQTENMTSERFHQEAVQSLEASQGVIGVRVEQKVTLESARVADNLLSSTGDMFGLLARRFDYTIAATAIYVNGEFEALLRTQSCLEHLKHELYTRWNTDPTEELVRAEFLADWEERVEYVNPDPAITEFSDATQARNRLDRPTMQMYPYTVVRGDSLGSIAVRFGTDVNRIMRDNGLSNHNIFPGDVLQIYTSRPLLSVRTYSEIPTQEPIPMETETVDNPELPNHITRVIQYGAPGIQETRELIIRENGVEISRETLETQVLVEPVLHIIEQGTATSSLTVR